MTQAHSGPGKHQGRDPGGRKPKGRLLGWAAGAEVRGGGQRLRAAATGLHVLSSDQCAGADSKDGKGQKGASRTLLSAYLGCG